MMMKHAIWLLMICLCAPLCAAVNGDVRQAGKLFAHEKYGEALSRYEKALSQDPQNAQANFGAGAAAYYLKEYNQAAKSFENAAQSSDNLRQDALFNLGNTYYRSQKKEQAMAAYKEAILQNPQDKEAIHNLQLLLKEQKQQNQNNQNNNNRDNKSQNQDQQDQQNNKGQAPQQSESQSDKQPQQPQPQEQGMSQQDAKRVMQLARDNEFRRPTRPGQAGGDDRLEKDW